MGRRGAELDLQIAVAGLGEAGMVEAVVWVGIAVPETSFGIAALPSDAGIGERLGFAESPAMLWGSAGIGSGGHGVPAGSLACTGIGEVGSAPTVGLLACSKVHRKTEQFSAWGPEN